MSPMDPDRATDLIRVGVVDDLPMLLELLCEQLQRHDRIDVAWTAGSVREATASLTEIIDVLVTDQGLPDGTGIELCRLAHREHPGIRCVILTGLATSDLAQQADEIGVAVLAKDPLGFDLATAVTQLADSGKA